MTGTESVAIVGAAESTEIGTVALSALGLATDAARRALADCGLTPADVDEVGEQTGALVELDDRDHVRCLEPRRRPVVDHVAVERAAP